MKQVSVLVAGGGPVGLTLARDLAQRGIDVMLVERNPTTTRHPKMDNTNVRSMELFGLAGLESALRAVAVPETNPFDVSWVTTMSGHELKRFSLPSPERARTIYRTRNDGSQPFLPPMRVSQVEIEPVLKTAVEAENLVAVHFGVEITDLAEETDGVIATLRNRATGETERVRCSYLCGCDGGNSTVRSAVDIGLDGRRNIMPRFMTHFRTDDRHARQLLQRWGLTWHYQSIHGTLIAQNDIDTWTLHSRYPENASDGAPPETLVARFVGREIPMEVLVANPWSPHLLVAERAGTKQVLLAGDAAHQYIPTGGYGMNTGVGDAFGLAWMIAAVLLGFGGPGLIDAYERERLPVWQRNCAASGRHNEVRVKVASLYGPDLEADGPGGDAARATLTAQLEGLGNAEAESMGIELGYHYAGSPIIADEPSAQVPQDPDNYVCNSLPGGRLPSLYLEDGRAVYSLLSRWFTLLVFGAADSSAAEKVAAARGIPLKVVRITDQHARDIYDADILLVRPDQHIAWRGAALDEAAATTVLEKALGW
jgi:2-polyprenyl-6-methoxyphenol hydroxylase-like FAD-dependent oxidoreductase